MMEFLEPNHVNTTTQIDPGGSTLTVGNLFFPDERRQFITDGFEDDNTTASVTISFNETVTVERIAIKETNLKGFTIFYDGSTANTFSLTSTGATTASDFSSNSETSMYLKCASVGVTSVTLDLKSTQTANSEKAIGFFALSEVALEFERNPSSKNYKPVVNWKQIEHKLSDGGVRVTKIQRKRSADIKFKHITETFRNDLFTIYKRQEPVMFVPFGTTTSWDEFIAEMAWTGEFDFFEYSDDAVSAGFEGKITLNETS